MSLYTLLDQVITCEGTGGASPPAIGTLTVRCKGAFQPPFSPPNGLVSGGMLFQADLVLAPKLK
jgi:hypothetical protein